jgi:hypothetical protein
VYLIRKFEYFVDKEGGQSLLCRLDPILDTSTGQEIPNKCKLPYVQYVPRILLFEYLMSEVDVEFLATRRNRHLTHCLQVHEHSLKFCMIALLNIWCVEGMLKCHSKGITIIGLNGDTDFASSSQSRSTSILTIFNVFWAPEGRVTGHEIHAFALLSFIMHNDPNR